MLDPTLTLLFEATGSLRPPETLGTTPQGVRRVIPIDPGGPFLGPRIRGEVMGGHDWQLVRGDGVTEVDATYLLRTDDGVLIQCRNRGLRHGPAEVMMRLARGEAVDPAEYYFRATPVFHAPEGRYDWLNRHTFVCTGARYPDAVKLRFYQVD